MLYLKHFRESVREIQQEGACREINTARGKAECCTYLETPPECCISRTDELRQCFKCYIVLSVVFSRQRRAMDRVAQSL